MRNAARRSIPPKQWTRVIKLQPGFGNNLLGVRKIAYVCVPTAKALIDDYNYMIKYVVEHEMLGTVTG